MSKQCSVVWAKPYHLELALDRVEKQMDAKATALRNSLSLIIANSSGVLWGTPTMPGYFLLEREEVKRMMAPMRVMVQKNQDSLLSRACNVTGGRTDMNTDIADLEKQASDLQRVIDFLRSANPSTPEHRALCQEQAAYLASMRDKIIEQKNQALSERATDETLACEA